MYTEAYRDKAGGSIIRVVTSESSDVSLTRVFDWTDGIVDHYYFKLASDLQGQSTATRLNKVMFEQYRRSGLTAVTVHADIDIGGYTWASAGFGWDTRYRLTPAQQVMDLLPRFERAARNDDERMLVATLQDRLANGDVPTPGQLADLGHTVGVSDWLGKRAMLGSDWHGRMDL